MEFMRIWILIFRLQLLLRAIIWLLTSRIARGSGPRPGDRFVSVEWLTCILRSCKIIDDSVSVKKVRVEDLGENRGLSSWIARLRVEYSKEDAVDVFSAPVSLILKMSRPGLNAQVQCLQRGTYREALLFNFLDSEHIPVIYYSYASAFGGEYVILLEDLEEECIPVNFVFGNQVWGIPQGINVSSPATVLKEIFLRSADFHARYWNDRTLLRSSWLKSAQWARGGRKSRTEWERSMRYASDAWKKLRSGSSTEFRPSEKLSRIVDASFACSSWERLQRHLNDHRVPFTLTHGDFHSANMFWKRGDACGTKNSPLLILDWSEVGVWEPMTDLGQLMISDVRPEVRREHERSLVKMYWNRLIEKGVSAAEFPFDECWSSYGRGGVERFIWIFPILVPLVPAKAAQYFDNQLLSFIEDHGDRACYELKPVVT